MSPTKDMRAIVRKVRTQPGVTINSHRGHHRIYVDGVYRVTVSSTPSNPVAIIRARKDLRRAGIETK